MHIYSLKQCLSVPFILNKVHTVKIIYEYNPSKLDNIFTNNLRELDGASMDRLCL